MALNCLALFLLSLIPSQGGKHDSHGMMALVDDPALRRLVLEGNFEGFGSAIDSALADHLSLDLSRNAKRGKGPSPSAVLDGLHAAGQGEQSDILGLLKRALTVAAFVTELQTLGPLKAMSAAVSWVESGLIRRSGLRPQEFPSFFGIVAHPNRRRLENGQLRALDSDLSHAGSVMDSSYAQLLSHFGEMLFQP